MNKKDINNWIMYHEIHKLSRMGLAKARIARYLVLDVRTVGKYLDMSEKEYEDFLIGHDERTKKLSPYEDFVKDNLEEYPDTTSAQIHDWLKERYKDLPKVNPRTVYNFVAFVRQKHNIPVENPARQYFPIEELAYGEQAQVDFGQYNMRTPHAKRVKVWFFAMVLARSRMKYIWFLDCPFTAQLVCQGHEQAFEFFNGIPKVIVYDQDRVMVVDENIGDIILTDVFKSYTRSRNFQLHFCRKADPESKGKVENVVQYVKKNFLYNRVFHDCDTLNEQALAWLGRTANALPHNHTKKVPMEELITERKYLMAYTPLSVNIPEEENLYQVRKTNEIAYKSNFYTLPEGTYQGSDTKVMVREKDQYIYIYTSGEDNQLICSHHLSNEQGKTIINNHHRRDTSQSIDQMMEKMTGAFSDQKQAQDYLQAIRKQYPRYIRDHLLVISKALKENKPQILEETLQNCIQQQLYSGNEFWQIFNVIAGEKENTPSRHQEIKLLNKTNLAKADENPQKSDLDDYESIINP